MTENEYQIGDYVYIEQDSSQPYLIRRIEEMQRVSNEVGTLCKVTCFYRRRDIPVDLLKLPDKIDSIKTTHKHFLFSSSKNQQSDAIVENEIAGGNGEVKDDDMKVEETNKRQFGGLPSGAEDLSPEDLHCLQQHELFMSRQLETLPAKNIRGKCCVVFLSDIDTPEMYIKNDDQFFYSLIYDKSNETLVSDKRAVSIGAEHQAIIDEPNSIVLKKLTEERKRKGYAKNDIEDEPPQKKVPPPSSINNVPVLPNETLIFHPHHDLQNSEIDQFLILSKAVGTFARAFDVPSVTKIPTLHVAAAAASRDTTHLHALSLLHHSDYNIAKAAKYLVPPVKLYNKDNELIMSSPSPLLCRDELEYWSPAESHIFAEALEKCNKDFHEIRQNYLPWKSEKDIIEYYYMYKTSDRYAQYRKPKKESLYQGKLKHVYILPYTKPSSSLIHDLSAAIETDKVTSLIPCESCSMNESNNWYEWGPREQKMRLCQECWNCWKKRGGLKRPHESERYYYKDFTTVTKPVFDFSIPQKPRSSNSVSIFGINGSNSAAAYIPPTISTLALNKAGKTFYFHSTILYKLARKLAAKNVFNPRKSGRNPFKELNGRAIMDYLFDRDPVSFIQHVRKNFGVSCITPSFIELVAKHCRSSISASRC